MKILFVFAHIDDAEIYCGGTMLKLKQKKIDFDVCVCCSNSKDKNLRLEELKEVKKICDYNLIDLSLEDGCLEFQKDKKIALKKMIFDYDLVITMNNKDYHADHRLISNTVKELASFKVPVIECDTLNGQNTSNPYIFNDITYFFEKKFNIIKCYKSQNPNYCNLARIINNFRGVQLSGNPDNFYEVFFASEYHFNHIKEILDNVFGEL